MVNQLTEGLGKALIFERFRPAVREYFMKAGIVEVPYSLFGKLFWVVLLPVAFIFITRGWPYILSLHQNAFIEFVLAFTVWIVTHVIVIAAIVLAVYFYVDLKIFNRTKQVEAILPEFLNMVSENLKGGMAFENALWSSIKPEFGVLGDEMRLTAKKVITGQDIDKAIYMFTDRYESNTLKRSFDLIIQGVKGGGKAAEVIDEVVDNLDQTRELKQDMEATNLSYVIFIAVIAVIVTPGLFALSFQFITVLEGVSSKVSAASEGSNAPALLSLDSLAIEPDAFKTFSVQAVLVITFFSSLMVSMLQKGDIKGGVKYVPMMMIAGYFMYQILMLAGSAVFGGLSAG